MKISDMDGLSSATLALAIIASFLLLGAGIKLAVDRRTRLRGVLMIAAAVVLVTNVMIWTV
jgi:hypothetical protein